MTLISALVLVPLALQLPSYAPPSAIQTWHLVLLGKGPAWTEATSPATTALQEAHVAHLASLSAAGTLALSGPIGDEGDLRAVMLLKTASMDEARAALQMDPAVKAGRLVPQIHALMVPANWYTLAPSRDDQPVRNFAFGLLKAGPNQEGSSDEIARLQDSHLAHLWSLREAGALVLAGPLADAGAVRGVLVFAVESLGKARVLAEADPMVRAGKLTVELHPWFTRDGVMQIVR